MRRRRFLRSFALASSGLFIPRLAQAPPNLAFMGSKSAVSNGLLAGTLGYWKMDENIASGSRADATGNGWTATDPNANVGNSSGLINLAANISTSSKGLSVSSSMDTRAQTTAFAISFWFKGSGAWILGNGIVARKNPVVEAGWLIYPNTNGGSSTIHWFTTTDAAAVSDIASTTALDANDGWQHLVAGYDGTNKFLYLNGSLDASFPVAVAGVARSVNSRIMAIGNYSAIGATQGQPGLYDEIAYFNFMPSASQVTTIYNSGNGLPFSSYS